MKTCRKCEVEKALTEFYATGKVGGGLCNTCKVCMCADSKKYCAKNPEKVKEKGRRYRALNSERAKEDGRKYRAANPERVKEYSKKYRAENPEKLKEDNKKYRAANREKLLSLGKEKKYGVSAKDVEQMNLTQGGACAICKVVPKKRLHIDHDHSSGKVRALLCNNCNLALGLLKDSSIVAHAAAGYLDYHAKE